MSLDVSKSEVQTYYGVLALAAILGIVAFFVPVVSLQEAAFGVPVSAGASGLDSVRLAFWLLDNFGKHMEAADVLRVFLLFFPLSFFSPAGVLIKALVTKRPDHGVGCAVSGVVIVVVGIIYAKEHFFQLAGVGFWLGDGSLFVPLVVHAIMRDSLAAAEVHAGVVHGMGAGMSGGVWASTVQNVVGVDSAAEELRRCPFCAEWIKKAAVRCRFCHSDVPPDSEEAAKQAAKAAADAQAAAIASAGAQAVAQEAEGLQAARELAAAGSWDEAKEFLNALLMREASPPAESTVGDYVLLASAEVRSGALGTALNVLKRIPREMKGEAGSEAASTLATLGRDAVVRKDIATAHAVREIAQRLRVYSGTTACVVGAYLDVQSAEEALQCGDDRLASLGLDGAREFLRTLREDERLPGLDEQIASLDERIKEKQQRRQKQRRLTIGLSLLGVVAASAGVYLLTRPPDTSARRSNASRTATPFRPPIIADRGNGNMATPPARQESFGQPQAAAATQVAPSAAASVGLEPCARAHAPEFGDPLATALKLIEKKAAKPTDVDHFREAIAQAENATRLDPQCAEAWSVLAFARYRLAYDICGRGDYASAEEAARKALELNPTPAVRSSALRNLGRMATARLAWDQAEALFNQAKSATPDNREVKTWLGELNVRKNPRAELLAGVSKALAGELLTEDDTRSLVIDEVPFVMNALLARHGRRMNAAVQDWFFFCDGTPLQNHPTLDPNVSRDPIRKNTPDFDNVKFLQELRKRLKSGAVLTE
jgi:tetratricopeptide (TPR) repeat protein